MFVIGKILDAMLHPLNWVALLLGLSLLSGLNARRTSLWGRRFALSAMALLLATGCQAVPYALIAHLESQSREFSPDASLNDFAGVIILGGAMESGQISAQHIQPGLNDSAERMTAVLPIWRHNPQLKLVFTGGEGALFGTGPSEAQRARAFFASQGLPSDAVMLEDQSRSTWENAIFTARLPGIDPKKRWLLLTSAWHMPRSMATFQKAGWNVTPYPVDFRSDGQTPLHSFSISGGADAWELYLHELVGLWSYRLLGRA